MAGRGKIAFEETECTCHCGKLTATHRLTKVKPYLMRPVWIIITGKFYLEMTSIICCECNTPCWSKP